MQTKSLQLTCLTCVTTQQSTIVQAHLRVYGHASSWQPCEWASENYVKTFQTSYIKSLNFILEFLVTRAQVHHQNTSTLTFGSITDLAVFIFYTRYILGIIVTSN